MKKIFVAMLIIILFEINLSLWATTYCDQKFKFLGVTGDFGENNTTFWIIEDVGGECLYSMLWQVADVDKKVIVFSSALKYLKYKGFLLGFNDFDKRSYWQCVEMKKTADKWNYNNLSWSITFRTLPIASNEIKKFYTPGHAILQAMLDYRINGFDLPQIANLDLEPIYCSPSGVFGKYKINRIFYCRMSSTLGYVLIFTIFESRISGMDTAHGFMVFRVQEPPKIDSVQSSVKIGDGG